MLLGPRRFFLRSSRRPSRLTTTPPGLFLLISATAAAFGTVTASLGFGGTASPTGFQPASVGLVVLLLLQMFLFLLVAAGAIKTLRLRFSPTRAWNVFCFASFALVLLPFFETTGFAIFDIFLESYSWDAFVVAGFASLPPLGVFVYYLLEGLTVVHRIPRYRVWIGTAFLYILVVIVPFMAIVEFVDEIADAVASGRAMLNSSARAGALIQVANSTTSQGGYNWRPAIAVQDGDKVEVLVRCSNTSHTPAGGVNLRIRILTDSKVPGFLLLADANCDYCANQVYGLATITAPSGGVVSIARYLDDFRLYRGDPSNEVALPHGRTGREVYEWRGLYLGNMGSGLKEELTLTFGFLVKVEGVAAAPASSRFSIGSPFGPPRTVGRTALPLTSHLAQHLRGIMGVAGFRAMAMRKG